MLKDQLEKELPQILLSSVQNIIHGNHVEGKELILERSAVYPFKLTVTIDWNFTSEWNNERIAGGKPASIHSGIRLSDFESIHDNHVHDAANNKIRRLDFINEYKNFGSKGLVYNQKKTIHEYPTHSYQYYCDNCGGDGECNCSNCSGNGRVQCNNCWGAGQVQENYTEYNNWNKTYEQHSRYVSCARCGGGGRTTCYSCSGSGRQQCSPCSGYGYFTYYRSTYLVAVPYNQYHVNCQEHAQKLVDHLAGCNHDHLYQHIYFNGFNYEPNGQSHERFTYYGDSFVTEIFTNLRSIQHHIVGYSNPPLPFIRSGIFDQLFIEEITALEQYQDKGEKIPKEKALKFFNEFSGQPVLERSLRGVAKDRTSTSQDHTEMIRELCSYFITQNSAQRLSDGINAILDKVSPAYNGLVWIIAALIYFVAAGIYIEYFLETFNISSIWDLILELVIFLFFTLLYYCAYSIITYLLSITVCTYKSRNIPVEFRQKFRNNEPFLATAFIGSFFVIIMGIYGYAAHHKTWLPNAGPTLLNLLFKSVNYIVPDQIVHKYCKDEDPILPYRNKKFICGSKYFININQLTDGTYIFGDPKSRIQTLLRNDNPEIIIDGKIGPKTKEAVVEYFKKRNMNFDGNWSYNKIAIRMEIDNREY